MRILNFADFLSESATTGEIYAIGAKGEEVKKIQQKLIDLGFLKISSPTGNYQEQTKQAVINFQKSKGFTEKDIDGIVGPITSAALFSKSLVPGKSFVPGLSADADTTSVAKAMPYAVNVVYASDALIDLDIKFDPRRQHNVAKCTEEGCAEWVSNSLSELGINRQGNAWHAVKLNQSAIKFNAFKNFSQPILLEMASLFSKINKLAPKDGTAEDDTRKLVEKIIPDQAPLKPLLQVNDIVGLYYSKSHNFTKAFYEGATGHGFDGAGKFIKMAEGPYFIKTDGSAWTTADIGKDLQFKPGNTLNSGGGFGFNTHLGYVGAIVDGEPIIFHNVNQTVWSTPFSIDSNIKVMWIKSGEKSSSTGLARVQKGPIDKFKDLFF
jgi:hypothetical protein